METKIFRRKLYDKMLQWKHEREGQTALLIKGARRVGKSTLAEEFASKNMIHISASTLPKQVMKLENCSMMSQILTTYSCLFNSIMECNCIHAGLQSYLMRCRIVQWHAKQYANWSKIIVTTI